MRIITVQEPLLKMRLDAWMLYYFQGWNLIARKLAGLQRGTYSPLPILLNFFTSVFLAVFR